MKHNCKLWLTGVLFIASNAMCQLNPSGASDSNCPPNIGFETGTLDHWNCSAGTILKDGTLNLVTTLPINDRHTIIVNTYHQELDPYGKFPVNCPNGSGYSVRLGNSSAGGQAESISYTFNIPPNNNDYSVLYNYAVVFQNPPHQPWEQPRFASKIYNVTDNKYIDCGSFQFVASSNLPGFELSPLGNKVFFKPWSPVTVNLSGLAGKTVRLEFSTNDCAFTQHFGYAYLDVNEDCSSEPISGNTYCGGAKSVNLMAPYGFAAYDWYPIDFSQLLGTQNILSITPVPPANTTYAVIITPYDGVGCKDTLYSTIHVSNDPFNLNVLGETTGCSTGVDITAALVTAGSTPGLSYSYYSDITQLNYVPVPTKITETGIYYIKGVNKSGCNDIKPIKVNIIDPPNLKITDPDGVCAPQKIDITSPEITSGSELGLTYSYWKNLTTTIPLINPNSISTSGTFFIQAKKNGGCGNVKPIVVKIGEVPNIIIHDPTNCGSVNLTLPSVTAGSSQGIDYTYWTDIAASNALANSNTLTASGNYFIKASSNSGCTIIKPVAVIVNPFPVFNVIDPLPVEYPLTTVDITTSVNQNIGINYSYWQDTFARRPAINPRTINKRGTYFIKGTNEYGCSVTLPVKVAIIPPAVPIVYVPTAFTPNNDGLNDVFKITVIGETLINHLRVYNRWGKVVYENADLSHSWNGKFNGIDLPNGVYVWMMDGLDTYFKKPFSQKGLITLLR